MEPLPSRSKASHASSEPAAVHERWSFTPSRLRSKVTPPAPPVSEKPSPAVSIKTGHHSPQTEMYEGQPSGVAPSAHCSSTGRQQSHRGHELKGSPPSSPSVPPSPPGGVGVGVGVAYP